MRHRDASAPEAPESVLIVGAGLAGACAAAVLGRDRSVTVLEAATPATGATGAAAGLVNPFAGRKASAAWRYAEALEALDELMSEAGMSGRDPGLLRPARDHDQAVTYRERASAHPDELEWLSHGAIRDRWPAVAAPDGGLWVKRGTSIDPSALVGGLLRGLDVRSGVRVTSFGEDDSSAWVEMSTGERLEASTVLLAPGDGFRHFPDLARLGLGRVKGQTLEVRRPPGAAPLPVLSGHGYVAPGSDSLMVGSTYEHTFTDLDPTPEATTEILARASRMVPSLAAAEVIEVRAGVRVTVPTIISKRRLPRVGQLSGFTRVWGMLGFGSKGLLSAPLVARHLKGWMNDPSQIPEEIQIRFAA